MSATTLNVRGIDSTAAERIKRASAARDMTIGQYLAALARLHEFISSGAVASTPLDEKLDELGLIAVTL